MNKKDWQQKKQAMRKNENKKDNKHRVSNRDSK